SKTFTVTVNGDTLNELNEFFFVDLSNQANVTIADGHAVGTILNDDERPTVSISDASVTEGDTGTVDETFTVSLSAPSALGGSFVVHTSDGTATAPADYVNLTGSSIFVSFAPGQTTTTVTVQVNGDTLDEPTESYAVDLS